MAGLATNIVRNPEIDKLLIHRSTDLKTTLKRLDDGAEKILVVVDDDERLFGVVTDGDIRRWILATGELSGKVDAFCNRNPIAVLSDYILADIKELMLTKTIEAIPVIDSQRRVKDVLLWKSVFNGSASKRIARIDVPVVIMAGGMGTRLDPFTRILPKPLIPIHDKPVIEIIIDKFRKFGLNKFFLSVNHKSRMIKAYFEEVEHNYTIEYIEEAMPLGTAGSLKYLEGKIKGPFFVSNCDIFIEEDYAKILKHHREKKSDLTVVSSVKHYHIPYGICEIENGGALTEIREKPEFDFLVNTGMYIINSEVLALIPDNIVFHITDLIRALKQANRNIGVFPVSEKSWIDVGDWNEYKKTIESMNGIFL